MIGSAAAAAAAVWSAALCALLLRTAAARRSAAHLAWGVAFAAFSTASAALAAGAAVGWNTPLFRVFYLFGAVCNVPWLAVGTVLISPPAVRRVCGIAALVVGGGSALLALVADPPTVFLGGVALGAVWGLGLLGRRAVVVTVVVVGLLTLVAVPWVWVAPLVAPLPAVGIPEGRELFGPEVRALAFGANTVAATIVIVGAVASALRAGWVAAPPMLHTRVARLRDGSPAGLVAAGAVALTAARYGGGRAAGNLLIAVGVLIASAGGALSFLGETTGNAVALAVGATVIYLGVRRPRRGPGGAGSAGAAR